MIETCLFKFRENRQHSCFMECGDDRNLQDARGGQARAIGSCLVKILAYTCIRPWAVK